VRWPFAGTADPRFSVDLNRYLSFENGEDLVVVVVTMQVGHFVRCHRLHLHDESPQAQKRENRCRALPALSVEAPW
jgi:hypothetical protein